MPLTDATARNAKPADKPIRLFDGGGLYLEVAPSGGKWWRLKYRFGGKEKRFAIGVYPEVRLKEARGRRDKAREMLRNGIDPSLHKQVVKAVRIEQAANSFEIVAREWYTKQAATAWTPGHARTVLSRLENNVFARLGSRPIATIAATDLLPVLRRVEDRGALETAHRILVIFGQVFRYAVVTGRAERDPSRDLRGALPPVRPKHLAAITDPTKIGDLLLKLDGYTGSYVVKSALRLAPLVFVRPGELRHAKWEDIDLDAAEWRFVASKTQTQHIVPLARQAVTVLRDLHPLTGKGIWVFPSERGRKRPMSNNTVLAALRILGIPKEEMSGHGFRATARTLLDEVLHERVDLIEHQLAHAVRDPLGRAYNRTAHLPERHAMMQRWADYLDELRRKQREEGGGS
ncbi:MAG: integrase arm-type DNA-binding domain-containing protein [Deltaproteobacteria bacterium]|nr:integrase arm-type DNA-binding domain-containing protein [Deltaproteobacteria bacterium]